MQIASRIQRQQLSLRVLLPLVGAAVLIIVGLLGMHTFSADPAGHGTVTAHHSATTMAADTGHDALTPAASEAASVPCDDACLSGTGQGHPDMTTACILALLAGLLLLLRPILVARRLGPPLQIVASSVRLQAVSILPHTPSPLALSISRT